MNRQMAAAILEHHMPKRNIHNKNKIDYLAYATAINALRREDALIDKVLEIIDRYEPKESYYGFDEYEAAFTQGKESAIEALKDEILALKGGEQG